MLEKILSCTFKKQSLKRNLQLENTSKGDKDLLTIMSLNTNGINNKIEELHIFLNRLDPVIRCLQETNRLEFKRRVFL